MTDHKDILIDCMMILVMLLMVGLVIMLYLMISHWVFGAQPDLKCLKFQSNNFVVITWQVPILKFEPCDGRYETISYFLSQNYTVLKWQSDHEWEVYLTR